MKEVDFDVILENAEKCYKDNVKWHFHILMPTCMFNKKDKFAIIFENEETKEQLVSFFNERPLKDGEKLEALFYGRV
ncbi:hypothetical protein HYZ41_00030 [archaeon]|nr:hypothetical protein [archaeon]